VTTCLAAVAKVNLSLRVLGKRSDGFHEIQTVFQAVDLADEVRVERAGEGITLTVEGADLGPDYENLAYRAAARFLEASGGKKGIHVTLVKRIPAGAGLGGGSSDAAAVLRCLAASSPWFPQERLAHLGAALGSDVPFFLGGSPLARAEGRGEMLTALPALPAAHVVLALPPVHVSTAEAYGALGRGRLEPSAAGRGGVGGKGGDEPPRSWEEVAATLHNDFEGEIAERHVPIARSLDALRGAGAKGALLSGSGAASFGLFATAEEAARVATRLESALGWRFVPVRTLTRMPEPRTC